MEYAGIHAVQVIFSCYREGLEVSLVIGTNNNDHAIIAFPWGGPGNGAGSDVVILGFGLPVLSHVVKASVLDVDMLSLAGGRVNDQS